MRFRSLFQPCNGVLGPGERRQQPMIVIGLGSRLARARRAGGFDLIVGFPHRPEPEFVVVFGVSRHLPLNP
jgi:hypothetical protein